MPDLPTNARSTHAQDEVQPAEGEAHDGLPSVPPLPAKPSVWKKVLELFLLFLEIIGLKPARAVEPAHQLARFRLHHAEFRKLLTANNSFLETLAELEQKLSGQQLFDPVYVEQRVMRAGVDVHRMVESLNAISDGRYQELSSPLARISERLSELLASERGAGTSAVVLDLGDISGQEVGAVGGKMANLGEIRNRLGLRVPDGFAVTTHAFRHFVRDLHLEGVIHQAYLLAEAGDVRPPATSSTLSAHFVDVALPKDLEVEILNAFDRLASRLGRTPRVAVRSSALGEDSELSFAGQYLTLLGVKREGLLSAWRQVVASLFSREALHYRALHQVSPDSATMAVGVIEMVDASASGVLFTRDPNAADSGELLIHAVRGLGVTLVDGQASPEILKVSSEPSLRVSSRQLASQTVVLVAEESGGTTEQALPALESAPILTDAEALSLAEAGWQLERHFGQPQDVEWALDEERRPVILQSRPLRIFSSRAHDEPPREGYRLLLQGGDVACAGVGTGIVVRMDENSDPSTFPEEGVLLAVRPSPRFVRVMHRAKAIVTDLGSTTGHMASLAREFRVPALLNTRIATRQLHEGQRITVDSRHRFVYEGSVSELLQEAQTEALASPAKRRIAQTPGYLLLEKVMPAVLPLHLSDPRSEDFRADQCQSLHDIARFVHEKSFSEMFQLGVTMGDMREASYQLDVFIPIDLYIIDLGEGLEPGITSQRVKPHQVRSVPLKALLNGMLDKRIPRFGAKPMDASGLFGIMMRHAMSNPEQERTFQDPSYALISDRYLNYTARVGYHFGVVDTYCGKTANKNYITLQFRGGAAQYVRRCRRSRAVAEILRECGFMAEVKGDAVSARFSKAPQEETASQLETLGRLLQFVRQMDAAMVSDEAADRLRDAFLHDDFDMSSI